MSSADTAVAQRPPDAAARRTLRVGFVVTHPIQYLAPLFAYLQKTAGVEITALYLSDFSIRGDVDPGFRQAVKWDIDLLAGYTPQFMGEAARRRRIGGFFSMVAPELWGAIHRGRFDALVIHGHNLAAHHVALAAAKASGTPVLARAETHRLLQRPRWKEQVRTPLLRTWYKAFDGFLAIGARNSDYYRHMGVAQDRIFLAPYVVENERFFEAARGAATRRAATRARLGLSGDAPAILYAAKFDRRKRPDDLVRAVRKLQSDGGAAQLVMVGSGLMDAELKALVTELDVRDVVFPGFINQRELPDVYAACDVFVLPSDNEPWGLAVNEAMCAGLPIVLSDEIGCAADLVTTRDNGWRFAAGDVSALAQALSVIVSDDALRARMGAASRARISTWSYAECAAGLRRAVETVAARRAAMAGR